LGLLGAMCLLVLALRVFLPVALCTGAPGLCGLSNVEANLFVQRTAPEHEIVRIAVMYRAGIERVEERLGPFERPPRVFACADEMCHQRLGGTGARAITYGSIVARFSPRGLTDDIVAHELAHLRVGELVGDASIFLERFPAWLNEGIAVIVSEDARYWAGPEACPEGREAGLPKTSGAWIAEASAHGGATLYRAAGCAAWGWMQTRGGWTSLPSALQVWPNEMSS